MHYNSLNAIISSHKAPIALQTVSDSFFVKSTRPVPYIEPRFSKLEFPKEKPTLLLVSAVGASGKTTTAHALSFDTQLPILDLAKHKAVGDNTLTGILTNAYPIDKVGAVLEGLRQGTYGIIIDGIDEGRSKTSEQAFEAFLDDLMQRSSGAARTTIVIFGRSQVLLSTWCYLMDKGANVGMVQLDPFGLDQARQYIDSHMRDVKSEQRRMYEQTRDAVLEKLGAAFSPTFGQAEDVFLSFIGYPPVLDAIAQLLREERNHYDIQRALGDGTGGQLEIDLLIRISDYLLDRDHDQKAMPNFVEPIASEVGGAEGQALSQVLYNREEQCARVLAQALHRPFPRQVIKDNALNERYEKGVATWCVDHPFLDDMRLRNAVFASVAVTHCALSDVPDYRILARDYASANRPTYHLLYIMSERAKEREIDVQFFNMLIQSCSEFLGVNAGISIDIDAASWEETDEEDETEAELTITIEFPDRKQERAFVFHGIIDAVPIALGPYVVNTTASLPCAVDLAGSPAVEFIGDSSISARSVSIQTSDLILRTIPRRTSDDAAGQTGLFINSHEVKGHVDAVSLGAGKLVIQCVETELGYPLVKYVQPAAVPIVDPMLWEKYRRLRRILLEFASHKKGGLAKYRDKIEHERVLRNELGRQILAALVKKGILTRDPKFYYLSSERCDGELGITWQELREHKSSAKLEEFLKNIA